MFKLTAKPLKGDPFEVEAKPEETVAELKKRIAAVRPDLPAETQKIIFSGVVLQDSVVVKDAGIKDGEFVVVMTTKPKPAEAAPAAAAAPAASPSVVPPAQASPPPSAEQEAAIRSIMEMGFPRDQVERCMQAAFNNPDRAVEYLMGGIPDNLNAPPAPAPAPAPQAVPSVAPQVAPARPQVSPVVPPAAAQAPSSNEPLAALRSHPRFNELCAVVQQNPQMLNQVLSAIASSNPQLLQQIMEHQDDFVRILQEPVQMPARSGGRALNPVEAMIAAAQAAQGGGPAPGAPPAQQPQRPQVQLTQPEKEAVERLQALGFPQALCIQAYMACEKNEEIAANLLFEQGDDS